jgi:hypothetical protein
MQRDERDSDRRVTGEPGAPAPKRRPYAKPALHEYGSIAKLTQSGGTTRSESGGMMACL